MECRPVQPFLSVCIIGTFSLPLVTGGWNYVGCYKDECNFPFGFCNRALPHSRDSDQNTVSYCQTHCLSNNYVFAGVEYGKECFCGGANENYDKHGEAPENECAQIVCPGDSSQYCGGHWRIAIYEYVSTTQIPTTTTMTTTEPPTTTTQTTTPMKVTTVKMYASTSHGEYSTNQNNGGTATKNAQASTSGGTSLGTLYTVILCAVILLVIVTAVVLVLILRCRRTQNFPKPYSSPNVSNTPSFPVYAQPNGSRTTQGDRNNEHGYGEKVQSDGISVYYSNSKESNLRRTHSVLTNHQDDGDSGFVYNQFYGEFDPESQNNGKIGKTALASTDDTGLICNAVNETRGNDGMENRAADNDTGFIYNDLYGKH